MKNRYMLADCLYRTWRLGDQPLREALQHAITAYVSRYPDFLTDLHTAIARVPSPTPPAESSSAELAASLSCVWYFGDTALRADVETIIRHLTQRMPLLVSTFKRVTQSAEVGVIRTATVYRIAP